MDRVVDARGLACPLPFAMAKVALEELAPGDSLVVLATDPEAPVDLGALAADHGRELACEPVDGCWRLTLGPLS